MISGRGFLGLSRSGLSAHGVYVGAQCRCILSQEVELERYNLPHRGGEGLSGTRRGSKSRPQESRVIKPCSSRVQPDKGEEARPGVHHITVSSLASSTTWIRALNRDGIEARSVKPQVLASDPKVSAGNSILA